MQLSRLLLAIPFVFACSADDDWQPLGEVQVTDSEFRYVPAFVYTEFDGDEPVRERTFRLAVVTTQGEESVREPFGFNIEAGTHRVRVEGPGFLAYDQTIEISGDGVDSVFPVILQDDPVPTAMCEETCSVQFGCAPDEWSSEAECVAQCLEKLAIPPAEGGPDANSCRPATAAYEWCLGRLDCQGLADLEAGERTDCYAYVKYLEDCVADETATGPG